MKKLKIGLGMLVVIAIFFLTNGVVFALPKLPINQGTQKAKVKSPAIDEVTGEVEAPPEFVADLPEGKLTKIVFIRYAPGFQKEKPCDFDGVCDPNEKGWCADCKGGEEEPQTGCYDFLAGSKPRWNWIEDYYIGQDSLVSPSLAAVLTWEEAASRDIFGKEVLGGGNWGVYDYINSVLFGDYAETGVLAVTAIWFRGKNIYEYDIMFDTDYFPVGSFDLNTVALHEFGHAAGLNDLYDAVCQDEVMYGYLAPGEVKVALGPGDTIGIKTLYR